MFCVADQVPIYDVHSILVYGTPTEEGNYYIFKAYDPNNLNAARLRISKDYTSCVFDSTDANNLTTTIVAEVVTY